MQDTDRRDLLRKLPAVDAVLRCHAAGPLIEAHGTRTATAAIRSALETLRAEIMSGRSPEMYEISEESIVSLASQMTEKRNLRRVINATGIVLHTNLGRSVLSERAVEAVNGIATGYSNLEYDLDAGGRGSRYDHSVPILKELTGAGDALVVNNCAGATLLALAAVAGIGGEVIVSRGQLIEIGGGFRIPEILEVSGAKLREVGTTNRTRIEDYERAIGEETRAILWVHPSNFEVQGFTESVELDDLAGLGVPVIADLGSGAMSRFDDEPVVTEAVRGGADLVIFSGDKLLGGPQAGIVVGSERLVSAMRSHPLTRALRADKLCLAALEATLQAHRDGSAAEELPTVRMLTAPVEEVLIVAGRLADSLSEVLPDSVNVEVVESVARSGGGTLPTFGIPSHAVRLSGVEAELLAKRLREAEIPVVGRVHEGGLQLDARTLLAGDVEEIVASVSEVLS